MTTSTTSTPEFDSELHRTAVAQLDRVAARLGLDPNIHERLRYPRRALVVSVPVLMDTGGPRSSSAIACTTRPRSAPPRAASATTPTSTSAKSPRWRCS